MEDVHADELSSLLHTEQRIIEAEALRQVPFPVCGVLVSLLDGNQIAAPLPEPAAQQSNVLLQLCASHAGVRPSPSWPSRSRLSTREALSLL